MPTSNWKGQIAVSKAETHAAELGLVPNRPLMDCRYDMIIDDGKKLWRVQVKYANGSLSNSTGSVRVKLAYETRGRRRIYTYNEQEVDALVVYIPKVDKLCWLPCELFVGKKALCLRLEPTLNRQTNRVIYAKDYFW
jgi:hypothetical protein